MKTYATIYDLFVNAQLSYSSNDLRDIYALVQCLPDGQPWQIRERRKKLTGKSCPHCGGPLFISDVPGYRFQCFHCDEDFYSIEIQ